MPEKPEHTDPMENHYRESFKGFREEPSQELLAKIKSKLPAGVMQQTSNKKGRFIWLLMVAMLISIGLSTIYLYRQQKMEPEKSNTNESSETPVTLPNQPKQENNQIKSKEILPVKRIEDKKNLNPSVQKEVGEKNREVVQTADSIRVKPLEEVIEEKNTDSKSDEGLEEDHVDFYQKQTKQYKDSVRHLFKK